MRVLDNYVENNKGYNNSLLEAIVFVRKGIETSDISDNPRLFPTRESFEGCVVGREKCQRGRHKRRRNFTNSHVVGKI